MSRLYRGGAAVKDKNRHKYHHNSLTFTIVKDVKEEMTQTTLRA